MKQKNFIIALLALFLGFFIFASSLIMASQNDISLSGNASEKTIYFGRMLPDHVFYPVMMIFDRGLLVISSGEREVLTRIYLADDRMNSAKLLLDKGKERLALSTLTKSQKYLIVATNKYIQLDNPSEEVRVTLLTALVANTAELKNCKDKFQIIEASPIDSLVTESEALITAIDSGIKK